MFSVFDWRCPKSPPWTMPRSGKQKKYSTDPLEVIYQFNKVVERKTRPPGKQLKARFGRGFHRVPSLEELDHYGGGGGGFKKDYEYQQSKELDPMEYAYLIQKEFVSSIQYKKKMRTTKKKGFSMDTLNNDRFVESSKHKHREDLSSLRHLDLATGWKSSLHLLVEDVISSVFARAQESSDKESDLSRLKRLGVPGRYLPTIAEAIQAEHLAKFKHLDLANSGRFGQKTLDLRKLVEKRLPAFLSAKILPYS